MTKEWFPGALCRGLPAELFCGTFEESLTKNIPGDPAQISIHPSYALEIEHRETVAKVICNGCDCQQACLDYATREGLRGAIYGGLNDQERDELQRSRRQHPSAQSPSAVGAQIIRLDVRS